MWLPGVALVKKSAASKARSVPQLVQIPVETIAARLGHVIDLRSSVAALIDGVGEGVDGHLGDGIEAQHEVGGEAAVQIGKRVVGLQAIHDVAVGERRQAVELHVAVAVRAAHEVVAAAGGVDEGAGGELQRVGQIAAGIGKILDGLGRESGRGVGALRLDELRLLADLDALPGGCDREAKIDGLGLAQGGVYVRVLLCFEADCGGLHGVDAGLELREIEPPAGAGFHRALGAVLRVDGGHNSAGDRPAGGIGHRPGDGAGGLSLGQGGNGRRQQEGRADPRH